MKIACWLCVNPLDAKDGPTGKTPYDISQWFEVGGRHKNCPRCEGTKEIYVQRCRECDGGIYNPRNCHECGGLGYFK